MKKINQQIILEVVYNHKAISRAEIAEITGLSPATVSNITKELLSMELLVESRRGVSRGGRKPILLELNPAGAYFIGLEWGISALKGILLNLNQEVLLSLEEKIEDFSLDNFLALTKKMLQKIENKVPSLDKIYGLGLGIHGLVDPVEGISLYAPHFAWEGIRLKEILSRNFTYPILLDNDVRMMALAEKWTGEDNFVFINTGPGLGAALVFDGEIFYGRDNSAGEFGHMTIVENGPRCSCGNYGCLEALLSLSYLSPEGEYSNWPKLIQDAQEGKKAALAILQQAAKYLGRGIANLLNLLNPEAVIIGGPISEVKEIVFPILREEIKAKALKIPSRNLEIKAASYGQKTGAIGAATRVLQELFKLKEGVDKQ